MSLTHDNAVDRHSSPATMVVGKDIDPEKQ